MNKTITTIIIIIVIVLAGYYLLKNDGTQMSPEVSPAGNTSMPSTNVESPTAQKVVTYTDAGYAPNSLTIKVGDTVTFVNDSTQNMWTASAMHPTHVAYSGTSLSEHCPDTANTAFDACRGIAPGASWSFTFNKAGSFGYHDHLHATLFGKIIVE